MNLLDDVTLERSAVVANCRMNRERNLVGSNGYGKELDLNPLDFLKQRATSGYRPVWLDLCCGTGRALVEAAGIVHVEGLGSRIGFVGVDLVGMFLTTEPSLDGLRLVEASLGTWRPEGRFDLITCVHGLHYIGDKLGLIARVASWLVEDGQFVANLALENVKVASDPNSNRKLVANLRGAGLMYDRKRRRITCQGRKNLELPYRYLGADNRAGPNYTGQAAVNSYYEITGAALDAPVSSAKGLEKRKPPCILRSPHLELQERRGCALPPR
jgi:SAM-dependent methyltransferase